MTKSLFNDVFISYSRRDKVFVRRLVDAFERINRQAWVDWEDIEYAEDWWQKIRDGIEASDTFIFVLTPESVRSKYCYDEVEHAVQHGKRIVPIVVEVISEDADFKAMHPAISQHNWMPFPDDDTFNSTFATLIKTLDTDPHHVRMHTRLMSRANEWDRGGRDTSRLLRGTEIHEAEQWMALSQAKDPSPTQLQTEYIFASRAQQRIRSSRMLIAAFVALAVTGVLAVVAVLQSIEANRQAEIARENEGIAVVARQEAERRAQETQSLALASQAREAFFERPGRAVALALEATEIDDPPRFSQESFAMIAYDSPLRRVLTGHTSAVYGVAVLPDGQRAISASDDATLILWDLETGEQLRQFTGHTNSVFNVTVSADGTRALSASTGGDVILWDIESGEVLFTLVHPFGVYDADLSPDETRIVTATESGELFVWDADTGEELARYAVHNGVVFSVVYSADGSLIASGGMDGRVVITDAETGEPVLEHGEHQAIVYTVDFAPPESEDGEVVVSGGDDGSVIIWYWEGTSPEDEPDVTLITGPRTAVYGVIVSHDGRYIVSTNGDRTIQVWGLKVDDDGPVYQQHTAEVMRAAFLPDDSGFVTASVDGTLMLWDMDSAGLIATFEGHSQIVRDVAISPDGTRGLSASWDNSVILWDLENGFELGRLEGHTNFVMSATWSPDGRFALTAGADGRMILWDVREDNVRRLRDFEGHTDWVRDAVFLPDGERAVSASTDSTLILWDLTTGEALRQYRGHTSDVMAVVVSADGTRMASASLDGTVRLWNITQGEAVRVFEGHEGAVYSVQFLDAVNGDDAEPLSEQIVSASADTTLIRWDAETGEVVQVYAAHENTVEDVAISADGELMASASDDGTIVLWNLNSGVPLRTIEAHMSKIYALDFAPDGRTMLSGAENGTVALWRTDTLQSLQAWVCANRYVEPFVEEDTERYPLFDLEGICGA